MEKPTQSGIIKTTALQVAAEVARRGFLILAMMLGSCAQQDMSPQPLDSDTVKTIVIIPSVPSDFRVATAGLGLLPGSGDHLDLVDDSSWRLNELVFDTAALALSSQYTVSEALPDTDLGDEVVKETNFLGNVPDIGSLLQRHVHSLPPADIYIVIDAAPSANASMLQYTPNVLQGLGVSYQDAPLHNLLPAVHTYLLLTIVNGRSFKTVLSSPLRLPYSPAATPPSVLDDAFGPSSPADLLADFHWQTTWAEMTQSQKMQILTDVDGLLERSIPYTLSLMSRCIAEGEPSCVRSGTVQ